MPSAYTTGLTPDQIDDLVENTLHDFEKDKWVDISTELQRYFAHENYLLGNRIGVSGGDQLQWQVKVRNTGAASNTGMYAVDEIKVADVMRHCNLKWTKQTTHMAYDVDESAFNGPDPYRILDLIKTRRHAALTDFAELMESNFWGFPADATDEAETKKPNGVPYWIVRNATTGFNGGVPIGTHTTVAGLSPVTYDKWRNWTGTYKVIDKRDLVRKMREAAVKCNFREPVSHPGQSKDQRWRICTTYEVISLLEESLEQQNQNLGNDVASKDGDLMFRRTPVTWVPYLDNNDDDTGVDATNSLGKNPIYGIDLNAFRMLFKTGAYMRKTKPIIAPNQHTVRHIHWDSWTQFQCLNRRCNFVLTQAV